MRSFLSTYINIKIMLITIIVQNYAHYIRKFFFLNYLLLTNSRFHNQKYVFCYENRTIQS